ncbi:MAG: YifB family Mg chelatase-like AAA ATPase [Bacillota bacterium]|nr:YifB family Mg chelatase-like AAA ATPase [Bacillota bacterium]
MLARILSYGLNGIEGYPITVEVDTSNGLPSFDIVGLPDAAVKESKDRVRSAIRNSGFEFPVQRITVNLAPAHTRKEGTLYDLPIAVGILAATHQIEQEAAEGKVFVGELSLDGGIRSVNGVLPIAIDAKSKGMEDIVLPARNAREAAYIEKMSITPAETLAELANHLKGEHPIPLQEYIPWDSLRIKQEAASDFSQIRGQQNAKRAVEIAAAGGHNILFIGPPGSGKTMLARSVPSILPELTFEEALEITKIHSIAGGHRNMPHGIAVERPFRSPHHSISLPALTGGGSGAKPGEVSMAHYGVLYLDELPEFERAALEAMRQPLEDGMITVSRVHATTTYPARFMLIASMNPCPCGNFGSKEKECRCTPLQIQRYLGRISGPLLDRIDIQIEMGAVSFSHLSSGGDGESSETIKKRVDAARNRQLERFREESIYFNTQMDNRLISKYCKLDEESKALLKKAFAALNMSARAYGRILKVARTIADLAGSEDITASYIAEAIQYRSLDRKYWGFSV